MKRREFISTSCLACAGIATAVLLPSCGSALPLSKGVVEKNTIIASLTPMGESNILIIRNMQLDSDILVVKTNGNYKALKMMCTHETQPLTATSTGLYCASHGSRFDLDGQVVKEPARRPLTSYPCEVYDSTIKIQIG